MNTLRITIKVSDGFYGELLGTGVNAEGYVPQDLGLSDDMGEDYLVLEIDVTTGKLLNWKPTTEAAVLDILRSH